METENLVENSRAKLQKKHLDMVVANNLKQNGAGFGVDTNIVTIITKDSEVQLPLMSKSDVAENIVQSILKEIS
jgi:phosphopantothenoylcysteine decarboxylase/phosphopantothenate--cysteine ligase